MNLTATVTRQRRVTALALLSLLIGAAAVEGATLSLEGRSNGDTNWIAGDLKGWHELDLIPCRVHLTGGAISNQTVTIHFPRFIGPVPGFSDLSNFSASSNAVITSVPALETSDTGVWSYTFTVTVTNEDPADVCFLARLAGGAYLNPGASLQIYGDPECMGHLQIFKPALGAATTLAKPVRIIRGELRNDKTFLVEFDTMGSRLYVIQYSTDLQNWSSAQHAVVGNGSIMDWIDAGLPETQCAPSDAPTRFYRLMLLP